MGSDGRRCELSMWRICAVLWFCTLPGILSVAQGASLAGLHQPSELEIAGGGSRGAASAPAASFYVAANGKDSWSGKLAAPDAGSTDGPFASLARAQIAVQNLINTHPNRPIVVMLREGSYYLPLSPTDPGSLTFTARDSGTSQAPVIWENYPGETPIVSGGEPIGPGGLNLNWTHSSGSLWTVRLPASTKSFEYLFYNGQRRLRPRIQSSSARSVGYYMKEGSCYSTSMPGPSQKVSSSLCNLGTFLRIALEISPDSPEGSGCPSVADHKSSVKCADRFFYNPDDAAITNWSNLNPTGSPCGGSASQYPAGDVELILFDAWTVDVMRISCVDTRKHVIYLSGATKRNPDTYLFTGPLANHRYVIENAKDSFDAAKSSGQTGIWFLDRATSPWTLNYLANGGENPNADSVVIAQTPPVSSVGGSLVSAVNLNYVTMQGITFEVDNFVPPPEGFNNDENGEDTLPAAIDCESCQNVVFDGITVRRTSASGIQIASTSGKSGIPATNDTIQNSAFYDIGSSGVRIGHRPAGTDRPEYVVQKIVVRNSIIQGYSRVFADGEGIAQANGHDLTYSHNDINDGYHAGISVCLVSCTSFQYTANGINILSEYNHLWNIMQGITSDGGTLYYHVGGKGGSGHGNKIYNNLVHDTTDTTIIDEGVRGSAYGGAGIYLDGGSAGVDVENNVVYRVAGDVVYVPEGMKGGLPPHIFNNNILAYGRLSIFKEGRPWWDGCEGASLRAKITHNIFYFDRDPSTGFFPIHGCAFSCGLAHNQFQYFDGNLYWRTDGDFANDRKAFHVQKTEPRDPAGCIAPPNPDNAWQYLTLKQWQDSSTRLGTAPSVGEDVSSTVTVNPGFGNTGQPSDFLLSKNPMPGFDFTRTNDTIHNAGRTHPVIVPPTVPATFPTYSFTSF
jgi:hypothetical protein